jgi:hypothetical protein
VHGHGVFTFPEVAGKRQPATGAAGGYNQPVGRVDILFFACGVRSRNFLKPHLGSADPILPSPYPASPRRRRIICSARVTGIEADRHLDRPLFSRTSMHNLSRTDKAFSEYFSRYHRQGYFLRKEHGSGLFAGTLFRMEVCDLTHLASASTKAGSFETRAEIIVGSIRINTATPNPALKADNKEHHNQLLYLNGDKYYYNFTIMEEGFPQI